MSTLSIIEQLMNGIGLGLILFMMAAGLTIVFGVMDTMNLAHGSLFMFGAYFAATAYGVTDSFTLSVLIAVALTMLVGLLLETSLIRRLYTRNHMNQVVATFGVILICNDLVKYVWGPAPIMAATPPSLAGSVELIGGLEYPAFRLLIIAVGIVAALALYFMMTHTRLGMLVRAGASNRTMTQLMGVPVRRVFSLIFILGAALAGIGGAMVGPVTAVQVGMGDSFMIPALVVIVIGGIGSIRGAFIAALLVGIVDTAGRAFIPGLISMVASPVVAADVGPALASVLMYILMIVVLGCKPSGLFPARG
ncbi:MULTISPECIES: branched-chain amino acid ABC transporter permease [unclassified Pusillimonas]|uniref:branched-chain amino acid ABC transporter permease n=1 Tax=unclassified Pusillimonas TaxID=2640016 RepID=UPI000B9C8A64|nr:MULTISPECIES: branched-chain amino acid ABC transporter permease [unclassified Pusillimonas]OXR50120.1 branched-chain amino acid ABC transporter permease [Pusillimonas sp. T2]ROT46498.1 branched-chain amino acid ABC transporter permease [Pusillimonas sp. NJUB218]